MVRRTPNSPVRTELKRGRIVVVAFFFSLCFMVVIGRLFYIQVVSHETYQKLADAQHLRTSISSASRGEILARDHTYDPNSNATYALAANKEFFEVYLNPTEITRPVNTAEALAATLGVSYDTMLARAKKEGDTYEPVTAKATAEQVAELKKTELSGIHMRPQVWRYYPDKEIGSHVLGFYGLSESEKVGRYGIEGFWEKELRGISQEIIVARGRGGSIIPETQAYFDNAVDGSTLILTIDRTIQFEVCKMLEATIAEYEASKGTLIIMESSTGKIRAMCNFPAFDPNNYGGVPDISYFNNDAVFEAYEPGSVFKPIAMAIAINEGVVEPTTVYEDVGEVEISGFRIRNFDKQAHGRKTMIQALQDSLNLGLIFATKNVSNSNFYEYIKKFGLGEKTGIELSQESSGSLGKLKSYQDVYKATASFGQGITVTPLQMIAAVNVIASDGMLIKPYIVDAVRKPSGIEIPTQPVRVRQVVRPETARTVAAMLVQVVEEGYDSKAKVDNYYIAGKTGTAQIAESGKYGNKTNHTFVGFGPATDPKFTVLIKLHNPRRVGFAADSTTTLFHDIAEFLLRYYKIPPSR